MKNNQVNLIGRLGKDPVTKFVGEENSKLSEISLATTSKWKTKSGEQKEKLQWHSLVAWDKLAEISEKYLRKGMMIAVTGELDYDSYPNREGHYVNTTKIKLSEIMILSNAPDKS